MVIPMFSEVDLNKGIGWRCFCYFRLFLNFIPQFKQSILLILCDIKTALLLRKPNNESCIFYVLLHIMASVNTSHHPIKVFKGRSGELESF